MVSEQGLSLKVIFQGSVRFPEVHRVTRQLNLFVNVADNDSVDKAVLEAMSSGIPVVTSNLAFSNILSNDLACRVCVPKNSSQRLVEKMIDIIDSTPEERKQFGQELRRVVCRDHSIGGLADRLIAIFTEISRGSSSESHDRH
jgi:glycosyltransferase involved in cell wall biosynthesis